MPGCFTRGPISWKREHDCLCVQDGSNEVAINMFVFAWVCMGGVVNKTQNTLVRMGVWIVGQTLPYLRKSVYEHPDQSHNASEVRCFALLVYSGTAVSCTTHVLFGTLFCCRLNIVRAQFQTIDVTWCWWHDCNFASRVSHISNNITWFPTDSNETILADLPSSTIQLINVCQSVSNSLEWGARPRKPIRSMPLLSKGVPLWAACVASKKEVAVES